MIDIKKKIPVEIRTSIFFGNNSLENIIDIINKNNKILIIGSKRALNDYKISLHIREIGKKVSKLFFFTEVIENPSIEDSDFCYCKFKNENIDTVIGIGGGSVMDLAKSVAISLDQKTLASKIINNFNNKNRKLKLILIPTTSGTGSELSFGSILTDKKNGIKKGLRGSSVAADFSLIDPTLTYSLSLHNSNWL